VNITNSNEAIEGECMMNIRIENFPPGVTVDDIREFLGDSDDIEDILLTDAGNSDDIIAIVKVKAGQTGATGMAEFIDGKFFKERRLSAQVLTLLHE
jgi:hypothetical protein